MKGRQGKQTILIVDDDSEWREFVCDTLGKTYPVRLATNGDDGLRIASETRPAAIVLDVMMPGGMDGFRTLCELKKNPVTRDIPVIMLSEVNALAGTAFDGKIIGDYLGNAPSAFLEKPVKPEQLLREVARVLGYPPEEGG